MKSTREVNWKNSLVDQIKFYARSNARARRDNEFEWNSYENPILSGFPNLSRRAKSFLHRMGLRQNEPLTIDWFDQNAERLWDSRNAYFDELSKLIFDSVLTLRLSNHRQYYFPRIDFDDLVDVVGREPFVRNGFPATYLGVPLEVFDLRLLGDLFECGNVKVITRDIQLRLLNSYRQYLFRRDAVDLSPKSGEVVYDCGACIGEFALLFAAMVGDKGAVHLFDPVPLHIKFCELQKSLNPDLRAEFIPVARAVGAVTKEPVAANARAESDRIEPNRVSTDEFPFVALDDYAGRNAGRVDFIKMDIEGAEIAALSGGQGLIAEQKPRLAISAYHRPEHLWEIPELIKKINPGYVLSFGHHTPISWESVVYAHDPHRPT